eukprot:TRINITY_DN8554_c0_g1_i2.p1 TRINITY_DN8554_c0_g1~~TRINITY_DN8554_c0_g1_i2.p1  ORF type:complete len:132 (+),score=21.62 TRINITY_DN8554_c0_g1_i2:54-449(+)
MLDHLLSFVVVGALWGCTNPLLNKGSQQENKKSEKKQKSGIKLFFSEIYQLITNWKFLLPFLLNQCGSVAYVSLLGSSDISLALPLCNSLAFFFTAATARLLGERPLDASATVGMCLVLSGVAICVSSKSA